MRVPLSWLREFVDVEVEPRRLADDLTLCGLAVDTVEEIEGDVMLDLDITTNRVDAMNVFGLAREVATLYGKPLRQPDARVEEGGTAASEAVSVKISASDLCPRFCARVLDVNVGPSPDWIRRRLELVGVRSISNIVDLTNYVMLEMGQPTHAFDAALIPQAQIDVRWAKDGETLTTLDGVARTLSPRHGVVGGREGPMALSGIMGGAFTEVSEKTTSIVLEAAYWTPLAIRRAAKSLGMHTEASHRFERGADPEAPPVALDRIAHLLGKIGAGRARRGSVDVIAAPWEPRRITLRYAQVRRVLGGDVPRQRCDEILHALGFRRVGESGEASAFEAPSWRSDVSREVDLIEEIARHVGLGALPTTFAVARGAAGLKPAQVRERLVRDIVIGAGFTESINYAFVSSKGAQVYGEPAVALENPMSEDRDVLRTSLVFPGLLNNLETNLRFGRRDVALFEIGHVFRPTADRPVETLRLAFLATGAIRPAHWSEKPRPADFFDGKGLVESVCSALGTNATFEAAKASTFLHPGRAARLLTLEGPVGYVGTLHPDIASSLDVRSDVVVGEIDLEALLSATVSEVALTPLARFPGVSRDLSVVADRARPAASLLAVVNGAGGPLLESASIVDRYEGSGIPEGKVSLTVRLHFQDPDRTLTGGDVQERVSAIVAVLSKDGVEIRGEG